MVLGLAIHDHAGSNHIAVRRPDVVQQLQLSVLGLYHA